VLAQCQTLAHLNLAGNYFSYAGVGSLAGVLGSAQRWLTSISAKISLDETGQRVLQEC
jgi:hypothetical protein